MTSFRAGPERLVHQGHVISLAVGRFEAPDGTLFEREIVHHPGAVSVVPMLDAETVLLVRQYRAPLDREMLEIPAGKRDVPGEPPEATAQRELIEEVGLRANRLQPLAVFHNSVGFCDEESHVFLGTDLQEATADLQGIEEQHMTTQRVALADVPAMIERGELSDAKTVIGLLLTMRHLER